MAVNAHPVRASLVPWICLGVGLGGFIDGILLHQILQWHHMLTSAGYPPNSVENLRRNTVFDGLFHVVAWVFTALGVWLLYRQMRRGAPWSGRVPVGGVLMGWGMFNLVEGVINHHVLRLHHVREAAANPLVWDLGFLAFGVVLVAGGWALARSAPEAREAARRMRRAA